jgi:N6-L-threonylcarbamoyladenine synthase
MGFKILGIDTSCDDTSLALLEVEGEKFKALDHFVSFQKVHQKYGGVYPFLAKREHKKNLPLLFKRIKEKFELLAVTVGPGLEPCLWAGIEFTKNLAKKLNLPIVPVNHLEAHILVNFFEFPLSKVKFPAVSLVVSGGHTQLILMEKIGKYKLIGETRDDAAGECLDKVARLLGLGYPGGPAIEKFSKLKIKNQKLKIVLPRPMIDQKNYDFSFSGLKTAVLYDFLKRPERVRESRDYKILMAKEAQQAVIDVLVFKTLRAVVEFGAKSVIFGGGVAANDELRRQFLKISKAKKLNQQILFPKKELCTDNGLMVALSGYFHREEATKEFDKIIARANLKI